MDRRRAAGLLLALAACIATATAAPTAGNHTALDLYDGAPDGCYYNFQHYGEGDRIMTNEPCLNCTCHNRMLMCYLKVCPFTKPIGQDCTIEKRADQCCPIVTCPDVPVDLLTSTTNSPAEYGSTGIGKLDKFGCSIDGKYFSEGSKVPPTPNKPCEHCYCIRNMTTCVMQECTLHVDGCTPIYHKDVCCPVRYSCDHPEDEMPLLDDLSTTVRPTPGFLLTTTTVSPVTQMSQDCVYDNQIFPDGALIKTEKACDHCYCMKGDIVCVVQECGTPMENEGKNCTALPPREGVCCPDTYICEGDDSTTRTYEPYDYTTENTVQEELTTLSPPRRTSSEGSGYRNEPDYVPYTEMPTLEPEVEGSGEEEEPKRPIEIVPSTVTSESVDGILGSTEEPHEYIPLTTSKSVEDYIPEKSETEKSDEPGSSHEGVEDSSEPQSFIPTTASYPVKESHDTEPLTDGGQVQEIGSGESEEGVTEDHIATTKFSEAVTERESLETQTPALDKEKPNAPNEQDLVTSEVDPNEATKLPFEHTTIISSSADSTITETLEENDISKDSTKIVDYQTTEITHIPTKASEIEKTKEPAEESITAIVPDNALEDVMKPQHHTPSVTSAPVLDDDFVTTESLEQELVTEGPKETEYIKPHQQVTASTPMLEEIERDTTEYSETVHDSYDTTKDDIFKISSSTSSEEKYVTEPGIITTQILEEYIPGSTIMPVFDQQEMSTEENHEMPEFPPTTSIDESSTPEKYSPTTTSTPLLEDNKKETSVSEEIVTISSEDQSKIHDYSTSTAVLMQESETTTTEPDKDLNTIPSDSIEDISLSQDNKMTTEIEENITTEPAFGSIEDTVSKQTTIQSDTSVSSVDSSSFTTESAFRKEDSQPQTVSQISYESTTVAADYTVEGMSTMTLQDHTKGPEPALDLQQETVTTSEPKYTDIIKETTLAKDDTVAPSYETVTPSVSVTEKNHEEETTSSMTLHEKLPDTTVANQEENEIFNEPRIPGEGDCLLNGVTYTNESAMPSTNKCQSGCKCISSIMKCDPIICSPPPEYMDNCETIYDSPESCCPTYICDHRTETIPPQSHSQMSGTEAPVVSAVDCHGDECDINEDKKYHETVISGCESGSCSSQSDKTQEPEIPEQSVPIKSDECTEDECNPILCTAENGCQSPSTKPCEGDGCNVSQGVMSPEEPHRCKDGQTENCNKVPTKDCSAGDCGVTEATIVDNKPTEVCPDKEGCHKQHDTVEEECKDELCKRKDISTSDQQASVPCTEPNCKQVPINTETSNVSELPIEKYSSEDDIKPSTINITEITEIPGTPTESSQHVDEHETSEYSGSHDTVTEQPQQTISEDKLTTLSHITDLVTTLNKETEVTTTSTDFITEQGYTIDKSEFDKKQPDLVDVSEITTPETTDITTEKLTIETSSHKKTTAQPDIHDDSENEMKTEGYVISVDNITTLKPIEIEEPEVTEYEEDTTRKVAEERDESTTIPSKISTSETDEAITPVEKQEPEKTTKVISEEFTTEPSHVTNSHDITQPSDEIERDESTRKETEESITEPSKMQESQEYTKLPEIADHTATTIQHVQDISSEPSKLYTTEPEEITGISETIIEDSITQKPQEEDITESSLPYDEMKDKDSTKETMQGIVTEPPKITDEQQVSTEEVDNRRTTLNLENVTGVETSTLALDSHRITETSEEDDTQKDNDITTSEPTKLYSTEFSESTKSSEDVHYTETTTEVNTEPSKQHVTESVDITKPSENISHEDTTSKDLEETGTESSALHTTETLDVTKSEQNLEREVITTSPEESSTIQPQIYSTDTLTDTKSPEELEHKDVTTDQTKHTSTEPSKTHVTQSSEELYSESTSETISEVSLTETSKVYPTEQPEVTEPTNKIDDEQTTSLKESVTEPSKTSDEKPQEVSISNVEESTTSKTVDELDTEPPKIYSTQQHELTTTSPEPSRFESTTMNTIEESVPESPKPSNTEPHEKPLAPQETDKQKHTTPDISEEFTSEPSIAGTIETEDISKSPEIELIATTTKAIEESVTELPKLPEDEQHVDLSTKTPSQSIATNEKEMDTGKPMVTEKDEKETPEMTTPQEIYTVLSSELTTPTVATDSKISEPDETKPTETTSETSYVSESQSLSGDDIVTEASVKDKTIPSSTPKDNNIEMTVGPITSEPIQPLVENLPEQQGTQKPQLETQTSLTSEPEDMQQPELQEPISTQPPVYSTIAEKEVSEQTDIESQTSSYIPTDEHITTLFETQDLTTSKPLHSSETPVEIDTELSTEENLINNEKPNASDEDSKTKIPGPMSETAMTTESGIGKQPQSTESDNKPTAQEETYSEEPVTNLELTQETTTKFTPDEGSATAPIQHEPSEPSDLDDISVTDQYESSKQTLPEQEYQTERPIQVHTVTDSDISPSPDQDHVEEKVTTPSSKLPEITVKESSETFEYPTTEFYTKPVQEEIQTELPYPEQKPASESTTQKDHLPEDNEVDVKPSVQQEQDEILSSTITESKLTTEYPGTESAVQIETETTVPGTESTNPQDSITSDLPSIDLHEIPTKTTITEATTVKATSVEEHHIASPEQPITESEQEATKFPDAHKEPTPSEAIAAETPETPYSSEAPSLEPEIQTVSEEHYTVSGDQIVTEIPESSKKQPELTTIGSNIESESSSAFDRTTLKYEYPEKTESPLEEAEHTDKIKDDIVTHFGAEYTTELATVTVSGNVPLSPEVYTEKQPEIMETVAPEKEILSETYVTTKKQQESEVYQTTSSTIDKIQEKLTTVPVSAEQETTILGEEISPMITSTTSKEEQSIPVVIGDIDKVSTLEPSIVSLTERITPATDKPLHETTAPEEEFILATSKATTVKSEEEVSTSSPSFETTQRSTEKPLEVPVSKAPEQPKPIPPEAQPTDEVSPTDEDGSFPPSGTSGYGQEPDYVEEDQTFGPGTCRYGGKVYVSAQQIPRDDPCDFCFCFRSDIICLQQSCPPPIHGCHEEPIQGFCCPRYECPVSMATTVNVTTTTTTTTTTLPPHFPTHSYKGSAQRRGCQIKGQTYKVGEVVRASSGPCLHCTCGGDGQMKCDPKVCTPEPMLRQMIAAAVSAKRRR